jgi:hypothetical protein
MTLFRSWALACAVAAALAVPAARAEDEARRPVLQCWIGFGTLDLPKPAAPCCHIKADAVDGCCEGKCPSAAGCCAGMRCPVLPGFGAPLVLALRPQIVPFLPPCTLMVQVTLPPTRGQQVAQLMSRYQSLCRQGKHEEAQIIAKKALELDPNCAWANDCLQKAARQPANCCDEESSCPEGPEASIKRRLAQPISLDFKDTPLRQCLEDLGLITGLNIVPDVRGITADGIDLQQPVTFKVECAPLKSALESLLNQLHLAYAVKYDVVQVTVPSLARGPLVTQTFPIGDLSFLPFNAFPGCGCCADPMNNVADSVMKLITTTICPQNWTSQGGCGTVDYFPLGRALVVCQTPDIQEQVADLLAALRRVQDELQSKAEVNTPTGRCMDRPPTYFPETPACGYSLSRELAAQEAIRPANAGCSPAPGCCGMPCSSYPQCGSKCCTATGCGTSCAQASTNGCDGGTCCPECCPKKAKHSHPRSAGVPMLMIPMPPMMAPPGMAPPCMPMPLMPCAAGAPVPMMPPPPGPPPPPPCTDNPAVVPGCQSANPMCVCVVPPAPGTGGWVVHGCKDSLHISGPALTGSCTHITLTASNGAYFGGHVHLKQEGDGQHIEVRADRGCVGWKDGRVEMCRDNPSWLCIPAGWIGSGYTGPAPGAWDLTKADKGIHVTGGCLEGVCSRVTVSERGDALMLEGHVHLTCPGQHAQLSADRVRISLADGALQLGGPSPQSVAVPVPPAAPCCTTTAIPEQIGIPAVCPPAPQRCPPSGN